jgi:Beta propeller domain
MARRAALIAALALLAAVPGASMAAEAGSASRKSRIAKSVRLKAFGSCGALVRYGRRHARGGVGAAPPISLPTPLLGPQPRPPVVPLAPDGRSAPGAEDAPGDSGTNVQEAGVDEPDLVKASRDLIFVVAGNRLHAVKADGLELLGTLPLEGWGHQLLLRDERLLMISQATPYGDPPVASGDVVIGSDDTVTELTEIDVSDPAAMKVTATERIRGQHVSSRLTGGTARVVIWSRPRAVLEPEFRTQLRGWLPRRVLRRPSGGRPRFRPAAGCRRVMRPAVHSGVDLLTVLTIDMEKGLPAVDSDAVLGGGQTVYASKRALYVGLEKWSDAGNRLPGAHTQLHKFDTSDTGATSYRSSGRVAGHLLNQFSMSEQDTVLRVATTRSAGEGPGEDSESSVVTLAERDGALIELGRVDGLGRGERIYAVRFLGDVAYVVTFRQVDPLYTVDLARPSAPRVVGELKIRGYSAYLHPIGEGLLLGVGQDATERGQQLGAQVSLFDVSDPAKPARLHQRTLSDGGSSEVEWDHHAFLWWPPAKLAVLPLESWADSSGVFAGAIGLRIDPEAGIAELGRTSHRGEEWKPPVRRSLIVGGRLVTISDGGVQQNSLSDLAEEDWLGFPSPE